MGTLHSTLHHLLNSKKQLPIASTLRTVSHQTLQKAIAVVRRRIVFENVRNLIVTGGGLSLDGKRWIQTGPRFLMYHGGLKKRWKYQVCTRMKRAHREDQWRFLSEP
jgi:hypothetical protein